MRILVVHPHYAPDTAPYGVMLADIAVALVADGHGVTVLTAQPSYNRVGRSARLPRIETVDGVAIRRVRGLAPKAARMRQRLGLLRFALRVVGHATLRHRRYDLITVATMPPVVMGVVARVIRRLTGTPFLYHLMDIYPEVVESMARRTPSWFRQWLRRRDTITCRKADAVIVPSKDMARTLADRGTPVEHITVIPHFRPAARQAPGTDHFERGAARLVVVFAGNMGRFQGLEHVVAAAHLLADDVGIQFVLVGEGALRHDLEKAAGPLVGRTVRFIPYLPASDAMAVLAGCDVGLVSLRPGVIRAASPSKTASYLEAGLTLLACVEPDSAFAGWIDDHHAGVHCPPGDPIALVNAIRELANRTLPDRDTQRRLGAEYFGRDRAIASYLAVFRHLDGRLGPR